MKLPPPRPCIHCHKMFQPGFRGQAQKWCLKTAECREDHLEVKRERTRQIRILRKENGPVYKLSDGHGERTKQGGPNGWNCVECGKPLSGPYRYRHPGACQQKMFAREQRTEGDWLYAEAGE